MNYRTAHALISGRCVNDCLFCAVASKRRNQLFPQKKDVIRFIRNVAEDGGQRMVFSGLGEPTLDPHFEEYLNVAAEMGFKSICLFTNGYGLVREKAEKWRAMGLSEVMLSIHGVEQTHDRVVRRAGSYDEAVLALRIYSDLGLSMTVNTCLTRLNLDSISPLRELLSSYRLKIHSLAFPEWSGNVFDFQDHMLDYQEIANVADQLVPTEDSVTFFDNIPYCLVRNKTVEMKGKSRVRLLDGSGDRQLGLKNKNMIPQSCSKRCCPVLHVCPGFDRNYIAARGWQDLPERMDLFLTSLPESLGSHRLYPPDNGLSRHRSKESTPGQSVGHPARGRLQAIIKATYRCNAACLYCSSHKTVPKQDVTPALMSKFYAEIFAYARKKQKSHITFLWHGGEPLLLGKPFFQQTFEESMKYDQFTVQHLIQTNLLLLDREWADLFKIHAVRLGTSADPIGVERVLKDGRQQFPDWVDKYTLAHEDGLSVGLVFTVTAAHARLAAQIFNFFRNLQAISRHPVYVRVNAVVAAGRAGQDLPASQLISQDDFAHFLTQLWHLWNESGRPFALSPFSEWCSERSRSCELSGSCHESFLALDGAGDIYHCGQYADQNAPFGNILQKKFEDILKHPEREALRRRTDYLRAGKCRDCRLWFYCRGGCPSQARLYWGDDLRETPFCRAYRMFFEQSGLPVQ